MKGHRHCSLFTGAGHGDYNYKQDDAGSTDQVALASLPIQPRPDAIFLRAYNVNNYAEPENEDSLYAALFIGSKGLVLYDSFVNI